MGGLRTGDKSDGDGAGSSDGDGDGAGSGDGGGVCEIASEKWKMFFEADFFFFQNHQLHLRPRDANYSCGYKGASCSFSNFYLLTFHLHQAH